MPHFRGIEALLDAHIEVRPTHIVGPHANSVRMGFPHVHLCHTGMVAAPNDNARLEERHFAEKVEGPSAAVISQHRGKQRWKSAIRKSCVFGFLCISLLSVWPFPNPAVS